MVDDLRKRLNIHGCPTRVAGAERPIVRSLDATGALFVSGFFAHYRLNVLIIDLTLRRRRLFS